MDIKRDKNNKIDKDDADKVLKKVTEDLITTQRDFQKEMSFRHAKTTRRDIVVKTLIYQKNTVNGMVVREDYQNPLFEKLSDDPLDPIRYNLFDYVEGELFVREMPLSAEKVGKWSMGMFKAVVNYLARMNIMNRV